MLLGHFKFCPSKLWASFSQMNQKSSQGQGDISNDKGKKHAIKWEWLANSKRNIESFIVVDKIGYDYLTI